MDDWLQLAIGAVIVALVIYAAWRNGQANPESTGRLAKRMSSLETTVGEQGGKIEAVEVSVDRLARSTATSADIAALRAEISADRSVNDRTWNAVDRLQNYFIGDYFDQQGRK